MRQIDEKYFTDGKDIFKHDHTSIPADEPLFLFRGRDQLVLQVLAFYLGLRQQITQPPQDLSTVRASIKKITSWQQANPGKVRTPR